MDYTFVPKICNLFNSDTTTEYTLLDNKYRDESKVKEFPVIKLPRFISAPRCYLCSKSTNKFHWFYYSLCCACGNKSYEFRHMTRSLTGYRAIVTGARIKLGFQVALKLLRCGAEVLITSRKWENAAENYSREPDYDVWKDRLHVAAVNFDLMIIDKLLLQLSQAIDSIWGTDCHIDIIIHNAAQTIFEVKETDNIIEKLSAMDIQKSEEINIGEKRCRDENMEDTTELKRVKYAGTKYPPIEWATDPFREVDKYSRVLDMRETNTWSTEFGNVDYNEAKQVLITNAWAPFVLNEFLLPRLLKSEHPYIIHVHAKEGNFSAHKTLNHTHTNMAKAALSMLTRCLGGHESNLKVNSHYQSLYAKNLPWIERFELKYLTESPSLVTTSDKVVRKNKKKKPLPKKDVKQDITKLPRNNKLSEKISIHGVDPGFLSLDEYDKATRIEKHLIFPPVDEIDASARVMYPILIQAPSFAGTWKHYVPMLQF